MPEGIVDLLALVKRLADRRPDRTEANVQSDLHTLLLVAPLSLEPDQINDIRLEQPTGDRLRIDVEAGSTVFEVKRDLRRGNIRDEAVAQLWKYVDSQSAKMGRRYVGVLTDGKDWHLYRLESDSLQLASSISVDPADPDLDALFVWLEGVLATAEMIPPHPIEVQRRLGSSSPGFLLDLADLKDLYSRCRNEPEIVLKRQLWSRLLFAALGSNFTDADELFVAHTYLVLVAEIVAHAVVGLDVLDPSLSAEALLAGERFEQAGIGGVVEADFFDWPAEAPNGPEFVHQLAKRIARFDWTQVEHDVLKTLYESVIDERTRHRLGEYYTPDWLAQSIVLEVVDDPMNQRVLDPSCGSGTFLFWSIRHYLAAADAANVSNADAIAGVASHVTGIDLHPVAVTLARVTYLMAIGARRLQDRDSFVVPVYLGDSIQLVDDMSVLDQGGITISTTDDQQELFAQQIYFPADVVANAATFDRLISELSDRARSRTARGEVRPIEAILNRAHVAAEHREAIERAYKILCVLHDARRNHVWGYYIRNLARPIWLSHAQNRADRLVGNPPWLRYNAMGATVQTRFRKLSMERGLWTGGAVATSQDLASLFVTRSIELYLRIGGRFGFVMPAATLSRAQFTGFRGAHWNAPEAETSVKFDTPWELSRIRPHPFPTLSCVVMGSRCDAGSAARMPEWAEWWDGTIGDQHHLWSEIETRVRRTPNPVAIDSGADRGFYGDLMRQGANLVPRVFIMVEESGGNGLGVPVSAVAVKSRRANTEREPWKLLPSMEGVVEREFVRRIHLGETLMPFRLLDPLSAVVPFADGTVLDANTDAIDEFPGLASWWRRAEDQWLRYRSETTVMSLAEQINYQGKLEAQYPESVYRVVYSGRGGRVAAALESDPSTLIDHALYWASVGSRDEGQYLVGVLNSGEAHRLTADYYSRGLLGARNIHKAAFGIKIPEFEPTSELHLAIAASAERCAELVRSLPVSSTATSTNRTRFRDALIDGDCMVGLDDLVSRLLGSD